MHLYTLRNQARPLVIAAIRFSHEQRPRRVVWFLKSLWVQLGRPQPGSSRRMRLRWHRVGGLRARHTGQVRPLPEGVAVEGATLHCTRGVTVEAATLHCSRGVVPEPWADPDPAEIYVVVVFQAVRARTRLTWLRQIYLYLSCTCGPWTGGVHLS